MATRGVGIDIIEITKIKETAEKRGERFLSRVFSELEREYCEKKGPNRYQHYAARFAAKEAFLKALGTGWQKGIRWTDVEISNDPLGKPRIDLRGKAKQIAMDLDASQVVVSISHCENYVVACAILE